MEKIAIIPARSGSKGLPDKNILMLGDKEMVAYSIEAAIKSEVFQKVIVSTDSLEYRDICEKYGASVIMRDEKLASDTASSFEVIKDVIEKLEKSGENYDYFVLLQPTSPFRNEKHVLEAVEKFEREAENYDFLVSMAESEKTKQLINSIDEDESLKNYDIDFSNYRRQNYKEYYPNGAIFLGKTKEYLEQKHFFGKRSLAYFMSKEDSVDIDTRFDFEVALMLLNMKNKRKILTQNIKKQILAKTEFYENFWEKSSVGESVFLLGHSMLDQLGVNLKINGKSIVNFGISGINSREFNEYVLNENLIRKMGKKVFLMFGTNDIVVESWTKERVLKEIREIINKVNKIKEKNKVCEIYFLEITKVRNRADRSNKVIEELNMYLRENLKDEVLWVKTNEKLEDKYGKLKKELTYDGLHLNETGNEILIEIIENACK